MKNDLKKFVEAYDWIGLSEAFAKANVKWHEKEWKAFITEIRNIERARCLKILEDEIATAHTTTSGKTSRLTSAYNRIKNDLRTL